eukprot:14747556-Alexandrium_andersonii.AAC.1
MASRRKAKRDTSSPTPGTPLCLRPGLPLQPCRVNPQCWLGIRWGRSGPAQRVVALGGLARRGVQDGLDLGLLCVAGGSGSLD